MTYQGWENYETWNAKLWIDNDFGEYTYWTEGAEEALEREEGDKDAAAADLAVALQERHEESQPVLDGMYGDLLTAAVGAVNWEEIAEALVETALENIPEESYA